MVFSDFSETCGPFDESLLERLAQSCVNLKKLEVSQMDELSTDNRQQITNMVVKIIRTN